MKTILFVVFGVLVAIAYARPEEKYTTKFDNVDVDEILRSNRLLDNYIKCLLDKGNCGPDAAELKRVLPDALLTDCSKCSEKQKEVSKKVLRHLLKNKRDSWNELAAKYDSKGVYVEKYRDELAKEGITV